MMRRWDPAVYLGVNPGEYIYRVVRIIVDERKEDGIHGNQCHYASGYGDLNVWCTKPGKNGQRGLK